MARDKGQRGAHDVPVPFTVYRCEHTPATGGLTNSSVNAHDLTGTICPSSRDDRRPPHLPCSTGEARNRVARSQPEEGEMARYPALIRYVRHPIGGHFAAWEQPQLLSRDLRELFRSLRSAN
jgi:hypothetical protein